MTPASLARLLRRIEAADVRAREHDWALMPADLARRLRARTSHVGDGLLTLAEKSDSLRINRVIGLGHRGQAKEAMIEEIIAFYRASRARRFSFMLSPGPRAKEITGWLLARGFQRHGGHTLLVRDCRVPVTRAGTDVRVARASREHAPIVVTIHERCFGIPASRRAWSLATARSSESEHYLAYLGTTPVAAGSLRVDGDLAWLGGGATLTRWRRRGAQSALIAARLRTAARRGCRWAWAETAAPVPGRPAGSLRNLSRLGFHAACVKPSFVWHRE